MPVSCNAPGALYFVCHFCEFLAAAQVSLSFVNGRLMAQTDAGPLIWNKGARGDVLKFIKASDEKFLQTNKKL